MPEVKAQLNYLRITPRKTRLVADLIKNQPVIVAESLLLYEKKRGARPILKLLRSAIANAVNNRSLVKDNLYVKNILVNQGPSLKRVKFGAQGRSSLILKRSSHITVILDEFKGKKAKKRPVKQIKPIIEEKEKLPSAGSKERKTDVKNQRKQLIRQDSKFKDIGRKVSGFTNRIFRRKSI